jgi:hypothetical protein
MFAAQQGPFGGKTAISSQTHIFLSKIFSFCIKVIASELDSREAVLEHEKTIATATFSGSHTAIRSCCSLCQTEQQQLV